MNWRPATERPPEPGWYLVIQSGTVRPLVLWWSNLSTAWRSGAMVIQATHWSGPLELPEPEDWPL